MEEPDHSRQPGFRWRCAGVDAGVRSGGYAGAGLAGGNEDDAHPAAGLEPRELLDGAAELLARASQHRAVGDGGPVRAGVRAHGDDATARDEGRRGARDLDGVAQPLVRRPIGGVHALLQPVLLEPADRERIERERIDAVALEQRREAGERRGVGDQLVRGSGAEVEADAERAVRRAAARRRRSRSR